MAERWANFAKYGNPNYEGGVQWNPWRYSQTNEVNEEDTSWNREFEYDEYDIDSEYDIDLDDEYYTLDNYEQVKFRKEALELMRISLANDNTAQRTEFKRMPSREEKESSYWDNFWKTAHGLEEEQFTHEEFIDILTRAQKTGLIGRDLKELLDFHWQPEARLVEEDCTCAMWDRIRYRY